MKLVKVTHWLCGEMSDYATLLWADDETTEQKFAEDCEKAQKAYLAVEQISKDAYIPEEPDRKFWEENANIFVAEAFSLWNKRREGYLLNLKKRSDARRSFAEYMIHLGYKLFKDKNMDIDYDLSWGHKHNLILDYGETRLEDVPGMLRSNVRYTRGYFAEHPLDKREV